MPIFIFNKLIRDNLIAEYVKMGQVATYRELSGNELLEALKQKIIEEANEIPLTGSKENITSELADIQQVIDVIAQRTHITSDEILNAKQKKFAIKGGFSAGLYVETLELTDNDVWVDYYRNSPEKYKEIT